jgi:hypothetical protein
MVLLPKEQTADGRITDVSGGGLRFTSPLQHRCGDRVAIDIQISPRQFVRSRIQIVREISRSAELRTYGAKFVDMGKLDRTILIARMNELDPIVDACPAPASSSGIRGFRGLIRRFLAR